MHELSIAMKIVETVTEVVAGESAALVEAVCVRVGEWSGVVPEALEFAWTPATQGTRLDGSRLAIDRVPAAAWCEKCGVEFNVTGHKMKCTNCGAPARRLLRGKELEILSVEVRDEAEVAGSTHENP